jgi:FkbM family methyltransferase
MANLLRRIHERLGIKYRVDRWRHYVRRFGVRGAMMTHRRIWKKDGGEQQIVIPGFAHSVTTRAGTADASTLEKIFVWNGYDLDYPEDVRTVIDAGANIGLSAVFFASRFPGATIVAIEPNLANYELLRRNTAAYPSVIPLHAALWSEDTQLGLTNPSDRVDSYRYDRETSTESVAAFGVPSLMKRFDLAQIDVLKVDIEGGERDVFAGRPDWVNRVRMFVIELHGDEARQAFAAATADLDAVRYRHGEDEVVRIR